MVLGDADLACGPQQAVRAATTTPTLVPLMPASIASVQLYSGWQLGTFGALALMERAPASRRGRIRQLRSSVPATTPPQRGVTSWHVVVLTHVGSGCHLHALSRNRTWWRSAARACVTAASRPASDVSLRLVVESLVRPAERQGNCPGVRRFGTELGPVSVVRDPRDPAPAPCIRRLLHNAANGKADAVRGCCASLRWFVGNGLWQGWRRHDGAVQQSARVLATTCRRKLPGAARPSWSALRPSPTRRSRHSGE